MNLTFDEPFMDDAPSARAEIDLFGVVDRKVIGGEVKTSAAEFTDAQVQRDVKLCAAVGAEAYVLASTQAIGAEQRQTAENHCRKHGLEPVVLDLKKLRPKTRRVPGARSPSDATASTSSGDQ